MINTTKQTKTKITVTNELGSVSRTTARQYTHVVMAVDVDGRVGVFGWSSRLDLAEKVMNQWAWTVTRSDAYHPEATIALCAIDGTIIRRIDRASV